MCNISRRPLASRRRVLSHDLRLMSAQWLVEVVQAYCVSDFIVYNEKHHHTVISLGFKRSRKLRVMYFPYMFWLLARQRHRGHLRSSLRCSQ